jgi:glycosyltransferase involved in cell wall biosynthesis
MKINIVRPTDGWILQRIAEAWQLPNSQCSAKPDPDADVNIWCNYAMFDVAGRMRKTKCDIGWFTHWQEGSRGRVFNAVAARVDWCISMCEKTTRFLPADRTTVIQSAPPELYGRRDIVLGVIGKDSPRKRTHLIDSIKMPGIVVWYSGGIWPEKDMPRFYESVDYVVVLSDNEGGPMCVPEAMATGTPVIAPDVGWCWDYPCVKYTDVADLVRVVRRLIPPTIEEESAQIMEVVNRVCS